MERSFRVTGRCEVEVRVPSGDVVVRAGPAGTIGVRVIGPERALENVGFDDAGGVVSVRAGRGRGFRSRRAVDVDLTVPPHCSASLTTSSGDVRVTADIASADIEVGSGTVRIGRVAGRAQAKAVSGSVVVDEIGGSFSLTSVSGDVRVGTARGPGSIATTSGDVAIAAVTGHTTIRVVSGDVTVDRYDGPSLEVTSMSGDIGVGFPSGLSIDADIRTTSGSISNRIEPSPGEPTSRATLEIRSMSGDVTLRSAP